MFFPWSRSAGQASNPHSRTTLIVVIVTFFAAAATGDGGEENGRSASIHNVGNHPP